MPALLDSTAAIGICIAAALGFGWTGIAKLRDWSKFRAVLENYGLLPRFLVGTAAAPIPAAELAAAATLPFVHFRPWPQFGAAALLVLFAAAMAINLLRNRRDIDCGCSFGSTDSGLRWSFVARNAAAAALLTLSAFASRPGSWAMTATGIVAGLALFALIAAAGAVMELFARHPVSPAVARTP